MFFDLNKFNKNAFRGEEEADDGCGYDYDNDYRYSDELYFDGEDDDIDGCDDDF